MNDKVRVTDLMPCKYKENCFGYRVRFNGINEEQGQYSIASGVKKPLAGDIDPAKPLTYSQTETQKFGTTIMYEVIPFEMLKTFVDKPQVIMMVGDLPAVCDKVTCDYMYTTTTLEVSGFQYDISTNKMMISGTFPEDGVISAEYGLQDCVITSQSTIAIECEIKDGPTAGKWNPIVITKDGKIPVVANLESTDATITSVSPKTELNVLGGDKLTIMGTNFPTNLEESTIVFEFADGQKTKCIATMTSFETITCVTQKFAMSALGKSYEASITINGEKFDISGDFAVKNENESTLTMTPMSVNPVLKKFINITLDSTFSPVLKAGDFEVSIHSKHDLTYSKRMNVVRVDDSTKLLECKYGGALSGDYSVRIHHITYGLIDTSALTLKVESHVSMISPTSGSINGGTLVTLTGINWGDQKTDNPVEISYNGALGSTKCFVTETSEKEIKCRIDSSKKIEDGKKGKMLVFLKTYEEANCTMAGDCAFTFTKSVPTATGVVKEWDGANNKWNIKVEATGVSGQKETTDLYIGSKK
jgi:hypothetical protein